MRTHSKWPRRNYGESPGERTGRACPRRPSARILVVRVRWPPPGRRGRSPPEFVVVSNGGTKLGLVRRSLVAAALVLVLGGCGSGPTDAEQVRSAVLDFGRATAAKDYQRLCDDLLAPKLVEKIKA